MIKAIKNLMLVMLLGLTTIANANITSTVPYVTFEQVGEQKVRLNLTNSENERPQLSIIDAEGHILHSESIRKARAFTKAYDFSTLQDGTYTIKLELDNRIVHQNAIVKDGKLTLGESETTPKPVFNVSENTFDVRVSGVVDANVAVEILNSTNETVYQKTDKSVNGVARKYIMKNLPNGDYIVKVTIDGNVYYHPITL